MMCSNCMEENDSVVMVCAERKYCACDKCTVTYGKNRKGVVFFPEEEVTLNDGGNFIKLKNRQLIIDGIYIHEEFESGRTVLLRDKETNKKLTHIFDINWLIKIKN
jgi:hypothetical protein